MHVLHVKLFECNSLKLAASNWKENPPSETLDTVSGPAGPHFIEPYDVLSTKLRCFSPD